MAFISTKFFVVDICQCSKYASAVEAYLEPSRTSRMELFFKNSDGLFVYDKNFSSNYNMIFAKRFFCNRYRLLVMFPETHLEPSQTSTVEMFDWILNTPISYIMGSLWDFPGQLLFKNIMSNLFFKFHFSNYCSNKFTNFNSVNWQSLYLRVFPW